jgi:predicted nucleic acid-binding protein
LFHNRQILHQFIEKEEDICITEIILTEILQGIKDDEVYETTKSYLLEFPIIKPKGTGTFITAAEIYRKCRKEGKTVRKTVDCIIATIAVENGLILLHNDNDFDVIEKCVGLKTLEI